MSDAWQRIVLDDASPEQQLGAMTLSELTEQTRRECSAVVRAALDEALKDYRVSDEVRAAMHAKVQAYVAEVVDLNLEKIKLRLQGREPVH